MVLWVKFWIFGKGMSNFTAFCLRRWLEMAIYSQVS